MRVEEQAFRAYYASMSDRDLLAMAANQGSFIELAQQILREELAQRKLTIPTQASPPKTAPSGGGLHNAFHKLFRRWRHDIHN